MANTTSTARQSALSLDALIPGGCEYSNLIPKAYKQIVSCHTSVSYWYGDDFTTREGVSFSVLGSCPLVTLRDLTTTSLTTDTELHSLGTDGCIWFVAEQNLWGVDTLSGQKLFSIALLPNDDNFEYSAEAGLWAFTRYDALYLMSRDGSTRTVFRSYHPFVRAGYKAAREEFGNEHGSWFSADGKKLAFAITDNRECGVYPIVCNRRPLASNRIISYPLPGGDSEHATIGIYSIEDGSCHLIQKQGADARRMCNLRELVGVSRQEAAKSTPPVSAAVPWHQKGSEDYVCGASFSPGGRLLLVPELSRDQKKCCLNLFSADDGSFICTLSTSVSEDYVEPSLPPFFVSDSVFVSLSRASGFWHVHRYCLASGGQEEVVRPLTSGSWEVTRIAGFIKPKNKLVVEATSGGPLGRQVLLVDISGNGIKPLGSMCCMDRCGLDKDKGLMSSLSSGVSSAVVFGDDACSLLVSTSSPQVPFASLGIGFPGGHCSASVLDRSDDPRQEVASQPTVVVDSISVNGCDLYYRLALPHGVGADTAAGSVPLVCNFYGGPHVQMIKNDYLRGTAGVEQMLSQADCGCAVLTIDPRGSDCRGLEFEKHCMGDIGASQEDDFLKGLAQVGRLFPCLNTSRVGVYGWSFGGYMAARLVLSHPDVFCVGVAGGPVADWTLYETMYTERYMSTPQLNAEGYASSNLLSRVAAFAAFQQKLWQQAFCPRLLLIHCNEDPVVLMQNSLELLSKGAEEGAQFDYMVYPGFPHNVRGPRRVHLMQKVRDYFMQNLLPMVR